MQSLIKLLKAIDQRGYKAYQNLQGKFQFPGFQLSIDHVQGDPFALPSRCRIFIGADTLKLQADLYNKRIRRVALEDFLGRCFASAIKTCVQGHRGAGQSGKITVADYGQEVLERNTLLIEAGHLELRLQIGLPADKRLVNARQASIMLFEELPALVSAALKPLQNDVETVRNHVRSVENQQMLRQQLNGKNLVAFIADGSCLPRLSGVDSHPLPDAFAIVAPESLAVFLQSVEGKSIRGLGIPTGVTLIVGGGFHGKSTLLHALELGVYDHIPGDGREQVVSLENAVKIRAEDRRAVTAVDISAFINNLPNGKDTHCFSTQDASGSTSQAANIAEALATKTQVLLIDEDTSATNFMIRDLRMQALIARDKEPITPLFERIVDLYQQGHVSVVLVMGGSGDYFTVADTVIMLDHYQVKDVTQEAKRLADKDAPRSLPFSQAKEGCQRLFQAHCFNPHDQTHKYKIQAFDNRLLHYGQLSIDLSCVEQLADNAQLIAIGYLVLQHYQSAKQEDYTPEDIVQALQRVLLVAEEKGLDCLTPYIMGTLAMPRLYELVATVNRMRNLEPLTRAPALP